MMDINSGQPWSEMSIADLEQALRIGEPIEQIATFLCRDVDEVRKLPPCQTTWGPQAPA
jgi:hypothetical protein